MSKEYEVETIDPLPPEEPKRFDVVALGNVSPGEVLMFTFDRSLPGNMMVALNKQIKSLAEKRPDLHILVMPEEVKVVRVGKPVESPLTPADTNSQSASTEDDDEPTELWFVGLVRTCNRCGKSTTLKGDSTDQVFDKFGLPDGVEWACAHCGLEHCDYLDAI